MENPAAVHTISGLAFRVSILGEEQAESYLKVYAQRDTEHGVVHVFSADRQTHYLTIPAGRALIEWRDPAVLEPQVRMPPFGTNAFAQAGEQIQRMMDGLGRGFGPG